MATIARNLPTPTSIGQTFRDETGVRWIAWSLNAWTRYEIDQDQVGSGGGDSLTPAQLAQLLALRNVPDGMSGTVTRGTWIRYTENGVFAYRLILSTGASEYSMTSTNITNGRLSRVFL